MNVQNTTKEKCLDLDLCKNMKKMCGTRSIGDYSDGHLGVYSQVNSVVLKLLNIFKI